MSKYNTDKPITNEEDDFFKRYEFSKSIADSIKNYDNPDCVVFGISGVWGEGKTSVLNFIERELQKSYPSIICLRFNPWRYNDENTLLLALFTSLARKIKESIPNKKEKRKFFRRAILVKDENDLLKKETETIGELLEEYGELTSVFGVGKMVKALGKGLSNIDIEEKKERIENILKRLKKRLVIFIDDIDRLDKDEIYSILRIVKLTGDFKYMSYVLSFDEKMVASAIKKRFGEDNNDAGYNFLEKIIQVPLRIPAARTTDLKNFCFKIIDEVVLESHLEIEDDEIQRFLREFSSHFLIKLTTPRFAVRYGNALRFSLPTLKGEVNNVDLMLVEAIKVFYPKLYDFIKLNPKTLTGKYSSDFNMGMNSIKVESTKTKVAEFVDSYGGVEKNTITQILIALFPQLNGVYNNHIIPKNASDEWYRKKRICSPRYFYRYFTYSVPKEDLSDVEFDNIISETESIQVEELAQKFEDMVESSSPDEFLTKLRSREKQFNEKEMIAILKAIVRTGHLFPDSSPDFFFSFGSPLSQIGIFINQLISSLPEHSKRHNLVMELISSADTFSLSYEINRWLRREDDEMQLFSEEEYKQMSELLINRALSEAEGKPIFETHEKYTSYIINVWSILDKEKLHSYIESKLDEDEKRILKLLEACTPTVRSTGYAEPYKGDFDKDQFNWINSVLDIDLLYNTLQRLYDDNLNAEGVEFNHHKPNPSSTNIAKQFVFWFEKFKEEEE